MSVNHKNWGLMCCICFSGLTEDQCAQDTTGQRWDVCAGECAIAAGIWEFDSKQAEE